MRERALVAQLAAVGCICGDPKDTRRTFCKRCYYALPPRLRSALYAKLGHGYEEAVDEAEAFLRSKGRVRGGR
jgi:hypothetical protein